MSTAEDKLPTPEPPTSPALTATCHCGRITIEVPSKPTKINECQCSVCYRYGALWAYYPRCDVTVTSAAGTKIDGYVRDDGVGNVSFNRCGHCGCLTHWFAVGEKELNGQKMGVNCHMLPRSTIKGVEREYEFMEMNP